jgi:hypothetical protein
VTSLHRFTVSIKHCLLERALSRPQPSTQSTSAMSEQRELFTQASNPHAASNSPFGPPPGGMPSYAPGAYGASGPIGHLGAGQQGTTYGTPMGTPGTQLPTNQPGYPAAPPMNAPGLQHPQQPSPGYVLTTQTNLASPPAHATFSTPAHAQQPTYQPEKSAYQPGWQENNHPDPLAGQAFPNAAGAPHQLHQPEGNMAYHQLQQPVAPSPAPIPAPPASNAVTQQPGASAPMTAASGAANGAQYDAKGERDWKHGLFDCFADFGTCESIRSCLVQYRDAL